MTSLIVTMLLVGDPALAGPPSHEVLEVRRQRVAEIQGLARGERPTDVAKLVGIIDGERPGWERVTAIKSLASQHRDAALPVLRRLAKSGRDPVTIEAAIQAYRFEPSAAGLRHLKRLRDTGASLRRAFWRGDDHGRPQYDAKVALPFLLSCLDSKVLHTRLDGALGLVEINDPGYVDRGLTVLRTAMSDTDPAVRLVALRYLVVPFPERALDGMLEAAREDPDPKVRSVALQIQKR